MDPDRRAENETLLAALRQALAEPREQRLVRGGKDAGLFPAKSQALAEQTLRDGLFEVVRSETRGKQTVEWVRITPAGVSHLHAHESPKAVLEDLRALLAVNQAQVPGWVESMSRRLDELTEALTHEAEHWRQRCEALQQRIDEALRRVDAAGPALANGVAEAVPWAGEALAYLDRRRQCGPAGACPLRELFVAIRDRQPGLSLTEFHDGVRRLADYKALSLVPFDGRPEEIADPEFAVLDGARVLYYVNR